MSLTLYANSVSCPVSFELSAELAEVLREQINLAAAKVGCNHGACGACTVWLDHVPTLPCMTLAIDVTGPETTNIESLAKGGKLHPEKSTFVAHDALQCGFFTPG